jgi:DNA-binding MarR family transcriptional regulator
MSATARLHKSLERLPLDPRQCVFRHFSRATRELAAFFETAFTGAPVTPGQFTILMTLEGGGPLPIKGLAEALAMDPTTVPRVLRPLLTQRFVRTSHGEDRRVRLTEITDAGREALVTALPYWERGQRRAIEALGGSDWNALRREIGALRRGLATSARPDAGASS